VEKAVAVGRRVQDQLVNPFQIEKQNVFLTASIGIALSSPESATAEDLVRGAGIALSKAKAAGGGRCEVFDPSTRDQVISRQQLESDLRRAIEHWEFRLAFQPIVSLQTGSIAGMEVLVRWHHPVEGLLAPVRFIPLAEDTGLIVPLNRAVIRAACAQARTWRQTLPEGTDFYLSVNLSSADLRQRELADFFSGLLLEYNLPPGMLRAEVTEGGMIGDVKMAVDISSRLREMGIPLLLDDFGTGYSSLSYLQLFKFDYLKIDIAFVRRVTEAGENLELIRAMVNIAQSLGMKTIAEGIETATVMKHLQRVGCDYGQGYYFSKPVEAPAMEELLRSQRLASLFVDSQSSCALQSP